MRLIVTFAIVFLASTSWAQTVVKCPVEYYGSWNGIHYYVWEECGGTESGFDGSSRTHSPLGCKEDDCCPDALESLPETSEIGGISFEVHHPIPPVEQTGEPFEPAPHVTVLRNVVKNVLIGNAPRALRLIKVRSNSDKVPPDRRTIWLAQFAEPEGENIYGRAFPVTGDSWANLRIMGVDGSERRRCFFLPYGHGTGPPDEEKEK